VERIITRTQVAIIGAGPAGLTLGKLLANEGIQSVVLEQRDRDWVEQRLRAGLLEPATVRLMSELGVDHRLRAEGVAHAIIKLRFGRATFPLDVERLTGRRMTTYPQQELVKDLIAARIGDGDEIVFGAGDVALHDVAGTDPYVTYTAGDGRVVEVHCEFIAGCDGSRGPSRAVIPADRLTVFEQGYTFGWLGILAEAPPSDSAGVYCYHENGFALASLRGPSRSRHYLQVDLTDSLDDWPDGRIWDELDVRLGTDEAGWTLNRGSVIDKSITPLRSAVTEPMRYGRLFLAGDSAHILPPTGAKGLNLAAADARTLGYGLVSWFKDGDESALDGYSAACLRRAWQRVNFSIRMTELLHVTPGQSPALQHRLRLSELEYLVASEAASTSLAEGYAGFELP